MIHIRKELRQKWDFQQLFSAVCDSDFLIQFTQFSPNQQTSVCVPEECVSVKGGEASECEYEPDVLLKGFVVCVFWVKIVTGFGSSCDVMCSSQTFHSTASDSCRGLSCVSRVSVSSLTSCRDSSPRHILPFIMHLLPAPKPHERSFISSTRNRKHGLMIEKNSDRWKEVLRGNREEVSRVKEFR